MAIAKDPIKAHKQVREALTVLRMRLAIESKRADAAERLWKNGEPGAVGATRIVLSSWADVHGSLDILLGILSEYKFEQLGNLDENDLLEILEGWQGRKT